MQFVVDGPGSWLVCFCAMLCQAINMGIVCTSGVLLPAVMEKFHSSRLETAWVGSIAVSVIYFASPVVSWLADRWGCRVMAVAGGLICAVALLLSSFSTTIFHLYLVFGALYGLGGCCVRIATYLSTTEHFLKRRSLATGIVSAGTGVGLFAFGPLIQLLLDSFGLVRTYQVLATICLAISVMAFAFQPMMKECASLEKSKTEVAVEEERNAPSGTIDCSAWRLPAAFVVATLASVGVLFNVFVIYQHLVKHCQEVGLSADSSSTLFMYIGVASLLARMATGRLCDVPRVKPFFVFQVSACGVGLVTCLLAVSTSYVMFLALSLLFGIVEGAVTITSSLLLLTIVEPRRRASAFGLANTLLSLSPAAGPPLAGFMADQLGSYAPAFYMSAGAAFFAAFAPFVLIWREACNPDGARGDDESLVAAQITAKHSIKTELAAPAAVTATGWSREELTMLVTVV